MPLTFGITHREPLQAIFYTTHCYYLAFRLSQLLHLVIMLTVTVIWLTFIIPNRIFCVFFRWSLLLRSASTRPKLREDERCQAPAADDRAPYTEGRPSPQQTLQRGPRSPRPLPAAHGPLRARPYAACSPLARALIRERNRCVRTQKGEAHVPILSRQGATVSAAAHHPAATLVYIQTNPAL